MKHLYLTALILFITSISAAQKNSNPSPEDITLAKSLREKYPKDDIAILYNIENISFELNKSDGKVTVNNKTNEQLMNINHRADIAKFEFYDSESEISEFTLRYKSKKETEFPVKDEIHKSDDLFYNDYRVKYTEVDFPVQGYSYYWDLEKKYKDIKYFTTLYFNDEYPTIKKEIIFEVPTWLELEIKEMNFNGYDIKKTKTQNEKNNTVTYTYTLENIKARSKDDSAPGPSYIYPHLLVLAKSYTYDNKKNILFNSTSDLYNWYKSLVNSVDENPAILKDKVKELTASAKTDEEKIKKIYYWVQDNIRYIAFEDGLAGFRPDASQNVFQKRYGDCKGMANLTCKMLKEAGFDARLTWIGTKRIVYDYTIPSLVVDNHMICTLIKDGKKYYLDGTEKYNSFGEYAERIQGKEVMIENGDNYIIEKVPVAPAATNKEVYKTSFKIENESLLGKVNGKLNGESRAAFLYGYNHTQTDQREDALKDYLAKGDKNLQLTNITTSNLNDRDIPLTFEYNTTLKNKVSSFDNEVYVDLDYLEEFAHMNFKERSTDYEFSFKKDYESIITLEVPAGYKVSALPKSYSIDNPGYSMSVSYEEKGTNIVYRKHFVIKTGTIKTSEFTAWNESVNTLKTLYNDQITLTKI